MATTVATVYISLSRLCFSPSAAANSCFWHSRAFAFRKRTSYSIKCSTDDASVSATETATMTEAAGETPVVEVPKGSVSLISALNVEKALRGIAITDADHYGRLGLQRGCSYQQVTLAYKNKVDELRSLGLEEEEVGTKLELLKESHSILSSAEERRIYDWSLARNENPDRYVWPFEVDVTPPPRGSPPSEEPEDVGPTRLVGYFLLGWLILSFTLSIALNR